MLRPAECQRTSAMLDALVADGAPERVTVADLVDALSGRSFGALLLVLALPGLIPGPPGFGGVFGLMILFFGAQMTAGSRRPWLPKAIGNRSMARRDLRAMVGRAAPALRRLERVCRPRLIGVSAGWGERVIGLAIVVLAIALVMPIPFTNFFPAVSVVVIAAGFIERDGAVILGGLAAGLLACAIVFGFGASLIAGLLVLAG
ncbi:MAG TPA: exopolysaccharide biosynthesis protein [Alphaproteobacteria bacterium]|nr:exopolysaccharide biosynthesis protein [Alphaproteobacteria bacterium]